MSRVSYDVSEVPNEIWMIISSFAARESLAQLCSVSHEFHSKFISLLYGNILDPPLDADRCSDLLRTLGNAMPFGRPHLAERVRMLAVEYGADRSNCRDDPPPTTALKNMCRLIPGAESMSGSLLRVLHWHTVAGLDELGLLLGAPGHFPNLTELVVSTHGRNKNFNFIQIAGLEVLGLKILLDNVYPEQEALCYRLAEALQMLPVSSPFLHKFKLNLEIPYHWEFPSSAYSEFITALNAIYLPFLTTLEFSVNFDCDYGYFDYDSPPSFPKTNLSPILSSHPNLLHLTLSTPDAKLPVDASFLPQLRSFEGSFTDAIVISSHQRELKTLTITFVRSKYQGILESIESRGLPRHPRLTHLRVRAVDTEGSTRKMSENLTSDSFAQLVSSFPNLTRLDICISEPMTEYSEELALLTRLQNIRLQERRTYVCTHSACYDPDRNNKCAIPTRPISVVFPSSDYAEEVDFILPSLPQLASVEIHILGDHRSSGFDWSDNEFEITHLPAEMELTYCFTVIRKQDGAEVVLSDTHIVSDTR
ncbi:hypothetical protein C8R46DRAFT_1184134 [Mycena filopes]|nr:hypothetical protein C8R46DRAFT_1184134 [Mycena filopes]